MAREVNPKDLIKLEILRIELSTHFGESLTLSFKGEDAIYKLKGKACKAIIRKAEKRAIFFINKKVSPCGLAFNAFRISPLLVFSPTSY